jgi:hypothetical protein
MDPVEIEYFEWDPEESPVSIHIHPGVVDGIARDVIEGLETLSRLRLEVGGLLLGRVEAAPRPAVWIERYQRISCEHRFGPQFILDSAEITALEEAAANILATGELAVVGLYRSNTRPRFQLEESDFELIRRYFSDSSDLVLLIRPESTHNIFGQFHAWDTKNGSHPVGAEFPFRGRAVTADSVPETAGTKDDEVQGTGGPSKAVVLPAIQREYPRRLVPDFVPSPVEPAPSLYGLGRNAGPDQSQSTEELPTEQRTRERLSKWLPPLAALLLVGGILWFLLQPGGRRSLNSVSPAPAQTGETARPIGLYVDPSGPTWRVLWNPNATALHDARNVQLFVREKDDQKGDDQNRIDLSARDLASGSYEYRPAGNDVTFRLEVIDQAGRVSAESFRLVRAANPLTPSPAANAPPAPTDVVPITQPKAIYKAPPVVAAGIRPRIKGTIAIDVRVHIDARGRVVSAAPVTKLHSGLDWYLAGRAVQAARLWRFEPARENGKAIAGTSTIHFVFEK